MKFTNAKKQFLLIIASCFFAGYFFLFNLMPASAGGMHQQSVRDQNAPNLDPVEAVVEFETSPKNVIAQVPATLQFSLKDHSGKPLQGLTLNHERILHVIIVSEDFSVFVHLHPEDFGPVTAGMIKEAMFTLKYTFPKAGRYLIALDSAVGNRHLSGQLYINVAGEPGMSILKPDFASEKNFGAYSVKLISIPKHIKAGEKTTLKYLIEKNKRPVTDLETYLAAPMHIAIILADLNNFIHAHGEIPASSSPHPPVGHIHGILEDKFGPEIEARVIFPVKGVYQIFSEFKHKGRITVTSFMVEVE